MMNLVHTHLSLVPLCGLVPFPHTPAISVSSIQPLPDQVGLLSYSNPSGQLSRAGVLANAQHQTGSVYSCTPTARFQLPKDWDEATSVSAGMHTTAYELIEDETALGDALAEEEQLHADVWQSVLMLGALTGDKPPPEHLEALQPDKGSASAFSLALAGTAELSQADALSMLTSDRSIERLRQLQVILDQACAHARAMAALKALQI